MHKRPRECLAVSVPRHPWRPWYRVARQQSRSCCRRGTDSSDPAGAEECIHVRKSVSGPTAATLVGQGYCQQVPSQTACTGLRESRTGR